VWLEKIILKFIYSGVNYMELKSYNPFHVAQNQFDSVAAMLELEDGVKEFLRQPMREYQFTIPVHMDDGSVKVFKGFRIA